MIDLDLVDGHLKVRMGKGIQDRNMDLTSSIKGSLDAYVKGGRPGDGVSGLSAATISGLARWAAKKARVDIRCNSLRHIFTQRLEDAGVDMETTRAFWVTSI